MFFDDIAYLKTGNELQRKAFDVLDSLDLMNLLSEFDPVLVGTVPINIAIEGSDLDIICHWKNKTEFENTLQKFFKSYPNFKMWKSTHSENLSVIASFMTQNFEIEIFGQNIPSKLQPGYLHMIAEHRLLQQYGEKFRLEILALKRQGVKTEPAFCQVLRIEGDPYQELLKI